MNFERENIGERKRERRKCERSAVYSDLKLPQRTDILLVAIIFFSFPFQQLYLGERERERERVGAEREAPLKPSL